MNEQNVITELDTYKAVQALLKNAGIEASFEYPGFLEISRPNGFTWAFGTVNETWGGDYMQAGSIIKSVDTKIDSNSRDAKAIARAIADAVVSALTDADILDQLIEVYPGLVFDQEINSCADVVGMLSNLLSIRSAQIAAQLNQPINPLDVLKPSPSDERTAQNSTRDWKRVKYENRKLVEALQAIVDDFDQTGCTDDLGTVGDGLINKARAALEKEAAK